MNFVSILKKTAVFSTVLAVTAAAAPFSSQADASSNVQNSVQSRSEQDIEAKWKQYLPQKFALDKLFAVKPNITSPYSAGRLNSYVLQDALNATNFARYLAGLPDDVTLDMSLETQQQAGAVLTARHGKLNHFPSQPSDMADDFYQLGYDATSSSNLSAGRDSLYDTVFFGYMADNGTNNLDTVGHRRWIINPQMKKTMFGLAHSPDSMYGYYSTMYAFNRERAEDEVEYDYIAWPSAGNFPADVLTPSDPWSVSLNTDLYDKQKTSEIKVTVTRERDNKSWSLDAGDRDYAGNFFNINTSYYGVDFAIIFRAGDIDSYKTDDVYQVTIDNLYMTNGEKTSISYTTSFFTMQASFKNTNAVRSMLVGQKMQFPITGSASRYVSSDSSIASVDSKGVVTAHRDGNVNITVDGYLGYGNNTIQVYVMKPEYVQPVSAWAKTGIAKAIEYGLVNNYPYYNDLTLAVTREEFVNYVVGMLSALDPSLDLSDYYSKKSPFTDVNNGDSAIIWAYEKGIISGTGKGKFSPYATMTREQAAVLLLNVYDYLGGKDSGGAKVSFADQGKVSAWAESAVQRAVQLSLLGGVSGNKFDPQGKYSQEQTIVTMLRLYEKFME
ncbi:S-layer homology domain-containing protein [Paenibacillus sp. NEAU-GSW1]|uniref:S-layer homology domain-containing protein n=1 Tax=Paenibacillus sp. NEAU-GSW1 TaxID=2682486 RepID=UPI0012E101A7|nr:S-layer homology domain-containing protein [Paenibacillus sp. NEAU-GSW1]MUT65237.1 S-layer protein [Paenibacillus sp. NEAU-GSW1]